VGGGDRDRNRNRNRESTAQRRSLGANTLPPFPPGRGPAKGRNELVEKLVIEDEPDRVRALVLSVHVHLLSILNTWKKRDKFGELRVRRSEHMAALARMREVTRDREVKEEAVRKGVTIAEWAILIDKTAEFVDLWETFS
jgi:hypothetical protein